MTTHAMDAPAAAAAIAPVQSATPDVVTTARVAAPAWTGGAGLLWCYERAATTPSDIHEHVPVLRHYASRCRSVLELGVRSGVSSWAILRGLVDHGGVGQTMAGCDLVRDPVVDRVAAVAAACGVEYAFAEGNDLHLQLAAPVDMTFIDTWHVYGQLKRELAKFAPLTARYIVMHDTQVDGEGGESLRCGYDVMAQALQTGMTVREITTGLRPAIREFLEAHGDEWELEMVRENNNGLTVLARKQPLAVAQR